MGQRVPQDRIIRDGPDQLELWHPNVPIGVKDAATAAHPAIGRQERLTADFIGNLMVIKQQICGIGSLFAIDIHTDDQCAGINGVLLCWQKCLLRDGEEFIFPNPKLVEQPIDPAPQPQT